MAEEILRRIKGSEVTEKVATALKEANMHLPKDVVKALERAYCEETSKLAKKALEYILQNIALAKESRLPVCQDTGLVTVLAKVGRLLHIEEARLEDAIMLGVRKAYLENFFRASVVSDPLYDRKNTGDNTPAVIHIEYTDGDQLHLLCMPKGFGSENMSSLKMFSPSATEDDIVAYVVDAVKKADANPCPPIILGIGIGGTFDSVTHLAKEALFEPLDYYNEDSKYQNLEKRILLEVNNTGIGAQGFGGKTTALSVHIKTAPTHVAGLPVAICFSCYATRRVEIQI